MAENDFKVSFGSNLHEFVADAQTQISALDKAIKGLGGSLKNLGGIDTADIKKLDTIAKALTGGGSLHIDTRQLDTSIQNLQKALAGELSKFSKALSSMGTPQETAAPATLKVDLGQSNEAVKAANAASGKLKQQAGWLKGHVEKLLEKTSATRAAFADARSSAEKTRTQAVRMADAVDSLNEKLAYATGVINQIRIDPPTGGGGGGGGTGGPGTVTLAPGGQPVPVMIVGGVPGGPAAAAPSAPDPGLAAAEEALANERTAEVQRVRKQAAATAKNASTLEELLKVRRDELQAKKVKQRVEAREGFTPEAPTFTSSREERSYSQAISDLTALTKRRQELAKKLSDVERERYNELNQRTGDRDDERQRLDVLSEAYREARDARLAEAKALRESVTVTEADTEATRRKTQATEAVASEAQKAATVTGAVAPAGPAAAPAAAEAVKEFSNELQERADQPGKQLAEGILDAFQDYVSSRRRTGEETAAFTLREQAARSGGRNLGTDVNLVGGTSGNTMPSVVARAVQESAKSVADILGDVVAKSGAEFFNELVQAFKQAPFGTTEDVTRSLTMAFPEGMPEEIARVLAKAVVEDAERAQLGEDERGAVAVSELVEKALRELVEALELGAANIQETMGGRPGEARTASAVSVGGRAKERDYGIFGGDAASRAAIDAAIAKIGEFGARMDELNAATAMQIRQQDPSLNPLVDLIPPQVPQRLIEQMDALRARLKGMASDDPGRRGVQQEMRGVGQEIGEIRRASKEFESARRTLHDWMVAADDAQRSTVGLTETEEKYAAARRRSLEAENRRLDQMREEGAARSNLRTGMEETLRRISVDPKFRDLGRTLPRQRVEDFPIREDTGDFRARIEEFNKKRAQFINDLAKDLELDPPERRMDVDARLRSLYTELDLLHQQSLASAEAELEGKRAQLSSAQKTGNQARVVAALEADIAVLEEEVARQKREQARAAKERELYTHVPRDPALAVGMQQKALAREAERTVDPTGATESIYTTAAAMLRSLQEAEKAFEANETLAEKVQQLEAERAQELEATAQRRLEAEQQLVRTAELMHRVDETGATTPRYRAPTGPQPAEMQSEAQATLRELDFATQEYERTLDGLAEKMRENERSVNEFKEVFKQLFPHADPRTGAGGRAGVTTERTGAGELRVDRAGAAVGPEDFVRAAEIVGVAINKAIVDVLGAKYTGLDKGELQKATQAPVAGTAEETLASFAKRLEEVVLQSTRRGLERLGETATSTIAAQQPPRLAGTTGGGAAPPGGTTGERQPVFDYEANELLRQINEGIKRLNACCERMADMGVAPGTAATSPKVAGPAPIAATQPMLEGMEVFREGVENFRQATGNSEAAAASMEESVQDIRNAHRIRMEQIAEEVGTTFKRAAEYARELLRGGVDRPGVTAAKAASQAAQAFGVERGSQEYQDLYAAALNAEAALKKQAGASREVTSAADRQARVDAARNVRMEIFSEQSAEAQAVLNPLVQELIALEQALARATDETERARLEEERRAKAAQLLVTARGTSQGPGMVGKGPEATRLVRTAIGGGRQYEQAGIDAAKGFVAGFEGVVKQPGAFSFIDRTLQTSVSFFIRSIAAGLTFGLQRQLRELVSVGLETEATFVRVSSAMDATGRSSHGLRGEITRISTELGVSLKDLYEITARLTGVFEDPGDVVRATESIATLQILSQGALNAIEGYRSLSAIQNVFWSDLESMGKTGEEAFTFINDSVVAMQDLTGINIEDLLEGAAALGGVTEPLNLGLLETQAIVGKVAQSIGQTGVATAEQLGRIFSNLQSTKFQEALMGMGLATQEQLLSGDFKQIFEQIAAAALDPGQTRQLAELVGGDRQFRAAQALFAQSADIVDTYTAAQNSAGRADERRKDLMAEMANQLQILGKNFENLGAVIVRSGFLNILGLGVKLLNMMLQPVNALLTAMNDLADRSGILRFVRSIAGLAAGFGALLLIAKALRNEVATFLRLGTGRAAQQALPGMGAAAPRAAGGMGGFMSRRTVDKVEVTNLRELGDALRMRGPAAARGESPLELARRVRAGELTHQKLRIGETPGGVLGGPAPDILTKSFPRAALDKTTGALENWGQSLEGVSQRIRASNVATNQRAAALGADAAFTARSAAATGVLAAVKNQTSVATAWLSRQLIVASGKLGAFALGVAKVGQMASATVRALPGLLGGISIFAMLAFAVTDMRKQIQKEVEDFADIHFALPKVPDEPDPAEERALNERIQKLAPGMEIIDGVVKQNEGVVQQFTEGFFKRIAQGVEASLKDVFSGDPFRGSNELSDATTGALEGWRADLERISEIADPQEAVEAARLLAEQFGPEEIRAIADAENTASRRAIAQEALRQLNDSTTELVADTTAAIYAIDNARNLTIDGVKRLLGMMGTARSIPPNLAGEFASSLDLLMEAQQIPEAFRGQIRRMATSGSQTDVNRVTESLLREAVTNAEANLRAVLDAPGATDDMKKEAESTLTQAMNELGEQLSKQINDSIQFYESMSELAQLRGGTGAAQLKQAIRSAQEAVRLTRAGSPERAAAELAVKNLQREELEATLSVANQADALAEAVTRDPMVGLGRQLATARRNLKAAQGSGLYTPEQLNQMVIEVTNLEKQVADEQNQINQAYHALAQSRLRDPLARAIRDTRNALQQLQRGRRLGLGEAELAQLEAQYNNTLQAEQDERAQARDAYQQLVDSRIRNPIEAAAAATKAAAARLNRAIAQRAGPTAIYNAQREYEDAVRAENEERQAVADALSDLAVGRIKNNLERALATVKVAKQRMERIAKIYGKNSREYIDAVKAFDAALQEEADARLAIAQAQRSLAIAIHEIAQEDVAAARARLADATILYEEAIALYGEYSEQAIAAREAMERARGALRDSILSDATELIDWQLAMEQITQEEAIAAYENILRTHDLTEKQRRDILLKIKQMRDSLEGALYQGQWNIGDIRVPTPFEMRRAIGIDSMMQSVNQVTQDFIGMFGAAATSLRAQVEEFSGAGGMAATTTKVENVTNHVTIDGADFDRVVSYLESIVGRSAVARRSSSSYRRI